MMDYQDRMSFLQEYVCGQSRIFLWTYSGTGTLLSSFAENEDIFGRIFKLSKSFDTVLAHFLESPMPAIISIRIGLSWGAACRKTESGMEIHVIGPVFNEAIPYDKLRQRLKIWEQHMNVSNSIVLSNLFSSLPVLTYSDLVRNTILLDYCLSGEKKDMSDVIPLKSPLSPVPYKGPAESHDYQHRWQAQTAITHAIREGDLSCRQAIGTILSMEPLWVVSAQSSMERSRLNLTALSVICANAAVEGGLSLDAAYELLNSYILDILSSASLSDMRVVAESMIIDYATRVHKKQHSEPVTSEIAACFDYIKLHIEEPLTIPQLANHFGYTAYYFTRRFKKETGISLKDYLRKAKIEHAKTYLESSQLKIEEIAERLSFSSRTHFSDCFKDVTGLSPQEYRAQTRKV